MGTIPTAELFPAEIHGQPYVLFAAMYAGTVTEGERVLQPLREFAPPLVDFSASMPYVQAQSLFDEDYPAGILRYYWKSLYLDSLSSEAIDCLPEHLFKLCVATAIKTATRLIVLDQQLHLQFARPLPHPPIPDEEGFGVNRLTLREILLAGLEDIVHFGKTCERFDQVEGGQVTASFADGTAATGDLLVGADGTHSVICAHIVPDARIDTLYYAIYGKTPIHSDTLDWVPDILVDSFNRIVSPEGTGMSVATCRQVASAVEALAKFVPTLHLTDMPGYFSWTLSLTGALRDADGPTLHEQARSLVKEWHPTLRRLIDEADIPATFPVPITSARPVKPWHTPNVTLLGDAIHTMSPGRGEGANVALRDAQLLCLTLAEVATNGASLAQAKAQYEREMLRYGFEAVFNARNKPYLSSASQEEP